MRTIWFRIRLNIRLLRVFWRLAVRVNRSAQDARLRPGDTFTATVEVTV